MKISIIGAGHIGGRIVSKLAAAGHAIELVTDKGPDGIRE
jgi:predicted dinucleotide-binding enzyme